MANDRNALLRWVYRIEADRLLAYEQNIARRFSHALVCTAGEKRDFERLFPGIAVSLVGNGVDLDYFRSSGATKQPGSIVFTGVMDYFPNVDAVTWFCDRVLPMVQAQIPEATLTICGSRPNPAVLRLAQRRGVAVTGRVPDTRPYLDAAEIFVAPLRVARGVQNKVLEALAMGLPCVASSVAWRGTVVPQGDGILVADDAAEFAERVVRLLRSSALRAEMAVKGARRSRGRISLGRADGSARPRHRGRDRGGAAAGLRRFGACLTLVEGRPRRNSDSLSQALTTTPRSVRLAD